MINGSVFSVNVVLPFESKVAPTGTFQKVPFDFFPVTPTEWKALVPISFMEKPGDGAIEVLQGEYATFRYSKKIRIGEGSYPSEIIKVAPKHVSPSKKDLSRIQKENQILNRVYATRTAATLWNHEYQIPVDSIMTSPYGVKRLYNGQLSSFHKGLDLRAPTGTPIHVPKAGRVALARDLFYTGNTVILDHGWGVFTIYAHMSLLNVREGADVKVGDQLGLSGSTGRSTGPHLHWGAAIREYKVNPSDLMKVMN